MEAELQARVEQQQASQQQLAEQQQHAVDVQAKLEGTITAVNSQSSDAAAAHSAEIDKLLQQMGSLRVEHKTVQEDLQGMQSVQVPELQARVQQLLEELQTKEQQLLHQKLAQA